jgi:hypothetical protein
VGSECFVDLGSEHEDGAGFSSVADGENIWSELQVSAMGEQGEDYRLLPELRKLLNQDLPNNSHYFT